MQVLVVVIPAPQQIWIAIINIYLENKEHRPTSNLESCFTRLAIGACMQYICRRVVRAYAELWAR